MIALEEAGLPYEARLISFVRGDHRSPEFLAMNPGGKVPLLLVDGNPLTENVAIISWIHALNPEAQLLPPAGDPLGQARHIADLAWCASGLHPLVTRMRLPQYFCSLPEARDDVRELAKNAVSQQLVTIERRLEAGPWWYGDRWSIVDVYINWIWFRVTGCGIDPADFPELRDHGGRLAERPSVRRVLDLHKAASEELKEAGLSVDFDRFAPATAGSSV